MSVILIYQFWRRPPIINAQPHATAGLRPPLTLITATLTLIDHPNATLIRLAQQTSIQGI